MSRGRTVGIIPARLESTRLPGKVLLSETGWPLIRHVFESARRAASLSEVVVATDDQRVLDACRGFGARAVATRTDHANGTSRLCEAATALGLGPDDVVVNVQGDEPEVEPEAIDAAVAALRTRRMGGTGESGQASIGTVAVPFGPSEDTKDPNCVKVVVGVDGRALYFSRSLIPFDRDARGGDDAGVLRHVGLYAYGTAFLLRYAGLEPTPLERAEQLEQLRALEHGYTIGVAIRPSARPGIDTAEQYRAFVERFRAGR